MKTKMEFYCGISLWVGLVFAAATTCGASDFERNLEKSFAVKPGGKLVVQVSRGSIQVNPDGGDKTQVHVFRQVKDGSASQAEEIFREHEVTIEQIGDTISVVEKKQKNRVNIWKPGRPNLQVRYQISIPKQFNVELATSGGDIKLPELEGYANARTSSGSIALGKITGNIEASDSGGDIQIASGGANVLARTSSGSIKIQAATGKIEAANSGGNIRIDDAGADVLAKTSSGSISVLAAKGAVEAKNSGGDIRIDVASGEVSAQTSSGTIHLGTVKGQSVRAKNSGGNIDLTEAEGNVSAQTSSGSIKIKSAKGSVEARNSGGDIVIGTAEGDVTAQTSSGTIHITAAKRKVEARDSGGNIAVDAVNGESLLNTSSGSILVGVAKGKVEAKNSGGKIEVAEAHDVVLAETSSGPINVSFAKPPQADVRLHVSGGGIKIALPGSAALNLDAKSSGGRVVNDLGVTRSGESHAGELQGKLNGGGPAVVLRASSGDIQLKRAAVTGTAVEAEDSRGK
jgi:hypothetical protein